MNNDEDNEFGVDEYDTPDAGDWDKDDNGIPDWEDHHPSVWMDVVFFVGLAIITVIIVGSMKLRGWP